MPHFPKPSYKARRRTQHALGKHPSSLPPPVKGKDGHWNPPPEIWQEYHRRMAEGAGQADAAHDPAPACGHPFVAVVVDDFIGWPRKRVEEGSKAERTLNWYRGCLASFLSYLRTLKSPPPEVPTLIVDRLEPAHVYGWVDSQPGWKTGKRGAMTAVQRVFTWAAKAGKLKSVGSKSPLTSLEKPAQGRRELLVSEEDYREVLGLVGDQESRDLLELAWETGCRPCELFTVEAAFVDLEVGRWVFPIRFSKGEKVQRVVYLSERALEITRRLALKHPSGPLLLNTAGRAWCFSSVKCRLQIICRKLGRKRLRQLALVLPKIPRLKAHERMDPVLRARHEQKVMERRKQVNELTRQHGKRLNLYAFRHSDITESLISGLDAVTASVLAGHRNTTIISRVYAHLSEKAEHLREAAEERCSRVCR